MTTEATPTRAMERLEQAGVSYRIHRYVVNEEVGGGYGVAVAHAIGLSVDRVFKTLVAAVDQENVVAVVPVGRSLSPTRLAEAVGGKTSSVVGRGRAEAVSGYLIGGISPFGLPESLTVVLDITALDFETIAVSGGLRGIQLEVTPESVLELTNAILAPITRD